jgi:hypothetical protein
MREPRLGDIIDDFCVKCKRIMNHAVVSLLNGEPAKVRCRTCHNDHDYRHEQAPPPKVDARKQALFNEVLAKVAPGSAVGTVTAEPFLDDATDEILPDEEPAEDVSVPEPEPEEVPVFEAVQPELKPKAAPKKKVAVKPAAKVSAVAKAKSTGRK